MVVTDKQIKKIAEALKKDSTLKNVRQIEIKIVAEYGVFKSIEAEVIRENGSSRIYHTAELIGLVERRK